MDPSKTYIFGYADTPNVKKWGIGPTGAGACEDDPDEIVLCAECGAPFHKAAPNDWHILRVADASKYWGGRDCDECGKQVYFKSSPPGQAMSLGYEPHRLEVFEEFLETLED